jgi:vacuolar iron transporter family protein
MKQSVETWITFGVTSWIITTLWLIVGLSAWSHMISVVIWGILIVAVSDAFSDAMGMYVAEEADKANKKNDIRKAALATFFAKLLVALSFVIPFLIFPILPATIISMLWGLGGLRFLSHKVAEIHKQKHSHVVLEHIVVGIVVVIITYFVGIGISHMFGK